MRGGGGRGSSKVVVVIVAAVVEVVVAGQEWSGLSQAWASVNHFFSACRFQC